MQLNASERNMIPSYKVCRYFKAWIHMREVNLEMQSKKKNSNRVTISFGKVNLETSSISSIVELLLPQKITLTVKKKRR